MDYLNLLPDDPLVQQAVSHGVLDIVCAVRPQPPCCQACLAHALSLFFQPMLALLSSNHLLSAAQLA